MAEAKAKTKEKLQDLEIENKKLLTKLQEAEQGKRQLEAQKSDSELLGHHRQVPTATSSSRDLGTFPRGFTDRRGLHTLTWSQRFVGLTQPGDTSSIQTRSVRVRTPVSGPGTISRVFARLGGHLRSLNPLR